MRRLSRRRAGDRTATTDTELEVNGTRHLLRHAPGAVLLELLRDRLGLTGTKLACGNGECGACTVLVDGTPVLACITLAARVRGPVETIEGLAGETARLREAFADAGAFQCGFCTSGQLVHAAALLRAGEVPADDHGLRHQLAGNICRCTGYSAIVQGIRMAGPGEECG
ncbi:(2Fe-2S)-binding protein [Amycolatopsis jejuensis]|uniref:(2Fe-2S)-binding protein n=1 Tax=Amycolatopsis jejuensis TaxID=330084 RepID=UPI000524FD64|nr:(2Fe-2S)-binding protein [Amycolatopsis jejuensis]